MKKRDMIFSILIFIGLTIYTYFLLQKQVYARFDFLFGSIYAYVVYSALAICFIFILFKKKLSKFLPYLKYPAFFIFMPFAFFPVLRCYFKVPFIFCKACPRPCPWGLLTPFIVPAFLVQNLDSRFWCYKLCPFGALQDCQSQISPVRIRTARWLSAIRYLFLAFTILVVFLLIFKVSDLATGFFFKENHEMYIWGLTIAATIFVFAFFIPRFFCNYFCPIGGFSDMVLKVKIYFLRLIKKK
jgi:polyferredoxin